MPITVIKTITFLSTFLSLPTSLKASITFPTLELSTLDGVIGTTFNGVSTNDKTGRSVTDIGDFNKDGFSDFAIGTSVGAGITYVIFGTSSGYNAQVELSTLNGLTGFIVPGLASSDACGGAIAKAGDVNGDGFDDFAIGAYKASPGGRSFAGSAFVLFGTNKTLNATWDLSTLNGVTNGFRVNGEKSNDWFSSSIASGDFNHDGKSDLIFGAPFASPAANRTNAGITYLVYGANNFNVTLEVSTLNGTNGFKMHGVADSDNSGISVSAGDFNGDGFEEILIGAYSAAPNNKIDAGSSFLIYGTNKTFGAILELSTMNGTNGLRVNGALPSDSSGTSVAICDINGDGLDDLVMGAPNASPGRNNAGSTFVVFGTIFALNATFELSQITTGTGLRIDGVAAGDTSGATVTCVGDLNGDGFKDLGIGALYASPPDLTQPGFNLAGAGSTYVVFGNASLPANIKLFQLNGKNGFSIHGENAGDNSGFTISGVLDVNGDGLSDLLIGAPNGSPNGAGSGKAHLVLGDTIRLTNNQLNISEGGTLTLNSTNLNITVSRHPEHTLYTIGDLQHGHFENILNPGVEITQFSHQDVVSEYVNVTHDDSELALSFTVQAEHTLAKTDSSPANITFMNQLPILSNNSLTINQGSTIQVTNSILAAIDPDNPAHNDEIIFNILGSSNCYFTPATGFSQLQVKYGGVYITQDNSIYAPKYNVSISRGDVTKGPFVATINFDTRPILVNNHFNICQGQTKTVTTSMLSAVHPGFNSSDDLILSMPNVQYGHFVDIRNPGNAIFNFSQALSKNNSIQFVHDGSSSAPSFALTISSSRMTTDAFAAIYFTPAPLVSKNAFFLNQRQTITLNGNMLNANTPNAPSENSIFTVSNLQNCNISNTQFTKNQLLANQINVTADDSGKTPSFDILVQNSCSETGPIPANIMYNSAPIIINNLLTLTLTQGKFEPKILTPADLSATDDSPLKDLIFKVYNVLHGYFETLLSPRVPITVFTQQLVLSGLIRFVPDNSGILPSYNVSVTDGTLEDGPQPTLVKINMPSNNTVVNNILNSVVNTDKTGPIVGGLVTASIVIAGLIALQCYLRKKTNDQLKKILSDTTSGSEQTFDAAVLQPIVNAFFNEFRTTKCFGQRTEKDTKAYIAAITQILLALAQQAENITLKEMTPVAQKTFSNRITAQIRAQSIPRTKGFSSCIRYCKPEVTPQEIDTTATDIASDLASWYTRHVKTDIELGELKTGEKEGTPLTWQHTQQQLEARVQKLEDWQKATQGARAISSRT